MLVCVRDVLKNSGVLSRRKPAAKFTGSKALASDISLSNQDSVSNNLPIFLVLTLIVLMRYFILPSVNEEYFSLLLAN